jgi:oligosaccharide repeat unit polymerase
MAPDQLRWIVVLALWSNVTLYAFRDVSRRPFLLAFCAAFFVFLLGGETLTRLFGFSGSRYPADIDAMLTALLSLGLLGVWVGHACWHKLKRAPGASFLSPLNPSLSDRPEWAADVRRVAHALFWITLPFALAVAVEQAAFVARVGYLESYTDAFLGHGDSMADTLVAQLAAMNFPVLALYLATMPAYRPARSVLIGWLLTLLVAMAGGQRAPLVSGLLFILCYLIVRARLTPEEDWLPRRRVGLILAALPLGVMVLQWVQELRRAGGVSSQGSWDAVFSFLLNQGVSAAVVAHGMEYRSLVPHQIYLLEFLHRGIPARLLGLPVLQGNSLERALEGGSYAHSVSYVLLGDRYLAGAGSGSSFLAEANFDLGLVGAGLIAVLFGILLAEVDRLSAVGVFANTLRLLILPDLLFAPRSSATAFLSTLLAPSTFVPLLGAMALAMLNTHSSRASTGRESELERPFARSLRYRKAVM